MHIHSVEQYNGEWPTTWWQQYRVLLSRGVKERMHHQFCGLKLIQVIIAALLMGLLWWNSSVSHLQDQWDFFIFTLNIGFFPLCEALAAFPSERMMLEKEQSSGMYRLSAYFMSKILGDLSMELFLPTIFVAITYWMAGLKATAGNFFHTLFALLYSALVSQGLGLAVGAVIMDRKSALVLGSSIMLFFILVSGYIVQNVLPYIAWVKYISIRHHTYTLLLLGSQYKPGDSYQCRISEGLMCLVREYPGIKKLGLDGQVVSVVCLAIMLVGYRPHQNRSNEKIESIFFR